MHSKVRIVLICNMVAEANLKIGSYTSLAMGKDAEDHLDKMRKIFHCK